jgi:diaminobutyrate acetyltransferase
MRPPGLADGARMWQIARDSQVLDVNASYAYLLWARDFAATSVVAETEAGTVAGFVTGYRRPDRPDTLMVWQVAVDAAARGRGIAAAMVQHLLDTTGARWLESTITADYPASIALFGSVAESRGCALQREQLFEAAMFPDGHDAEMLFRIGPVS